MTVPTAAQIADAAWRQGLCPPPRMHPARWADQFRIMGHTTARPGRWSTALVPYLDHVMGCLHRDHPCREVVLMKGTQTAGTEAGLNWVGASLDTDGGVMMVVWPDDDVADINARTRLDTMIEGAPQLARKFAEAPPGKADTIRHKQLADAELIVIGSNSKSKVRSIPADKLFLDECDAYVAEIPGQGEPCALLVKRASTFPDRKIYWCSSPTTEQGSRINARYLLGDQCKFYVPCPFCDLKQELRWEQVQWEDLGLDPIDAHYVCEGCGEPIHEDHKPAMLAAGEWRATVKPQRPDIVSLHLPALYSPFRAWGEMAQDWVAAQGDILALQTFRNTDLALPWKERGEMQDWQALFDRKEDYPAGRVPMGGVKLTCGVDTQKNRLEAEVVAWGPGHESWSVAHVDLPGSPDTPAVWELLTELLDQEWEHEGGGKLKISMLAIDEGGHHVDQVRDWSRRKPRVMVCKGEASDQHPLQRGKDLDVRDRRTGSRRKIGGYLHRIGTGFFKRRLLERLPLDPRQVGLLAGDRPVGLCHFPADYPETWFQQLTSEALMTVRLKNGKQVERWTKLQDRNEALDCRVLAMAATYKLGLWQKPLTYWEAERRQLGIVAAAQLELDAIGDGQPDEHAPVAAYQPNALIAAGRPRRRARFRQVGQIEV